MLIGIHDTPVSALKLYMFMFFHAIANTSHGALYQVYIIIMVEEWFCMSLGLQVLFKRLLCGCAPGNSVGVQHA